MVLEVADGSARSSQVPSLRNSQFTTSSIFFSDPSEFEEVLQSLILFDLVRVPDSVMRHLDTVHVH